MKLRGSMLFVPDANARYIGACNLSMETSMTMKDSCRRSRSRRSSGLTKIIDTREANRASAPDALHQRIA